MVQSLNKKVDLHIKASYLKGLTTSGHVLIGDEAFEYYNEKNVADYIQIPYGQIELITASVIFNKFINRFAIHTKKDGDFVFSTRNNKKTLKALSKYLPDEKLRRSLTIKDYFKR